mgnify:CR=1 FL=1
MRHTSVSCIRTLVCAPPTPNAANARNNMASTGCNKDCIRGGHTAGACVCARHPSTDIMHQHDLDGWAHVSARRWHASCVGGDCNISPSTPPLSQNTHSSSRWLVVLDAISLYTRWTCMNTRYACACCPNTCVAYPLTDWFPFS